MELQQSPCLPPLSLKGALRNLVVCISGSLLKDEVGHLIGYLNYTISVSL